MKYAKSNVDEILCPMRRRAFLLAIVGCLVALVGCGKKNNPVDAFHEDEHAKALLQGIWLNEDADDVAFQVKGDTIYYPDSTSQPMYFYIHSDTLVMKGASEVKYPIVKQAAHLFEFKNQGGDIIKLVKTSDKSYMSAFREERPIALNQNKLVKRDSVVVFAGEKYHLYVQVNPTTYKVYKSSYNDDGVQVENVYYDNIVNVNIYKGASKVFSRDFHRKDFAKKVPVSFLEQAILSDMVINHVDKDGFHYLAILAQPDSYLSYQVKVQVSLNGSLKIQKMG